MKATRLEMYVEVTQASIVQFDKVELETKVESVYGDVIGWVHGFPLIIGFDHPERHFHIDEPAADEARAGVIRIDLSAILGCFLGIQERACSHSKSSSNHICSIAPRMFTGSTIRVETGLLSGRKLICPTQRTCPHQTSLPAPGTPQQHQAKTTH